MPKEIDPDPRHRTARLVSEWRIGVGHEPARRWMLSADRDDGPCDGVNSAEHTEIGWLKAGDSCLGEDFVTLRARK